MNQIHFRETDKKDRCHVLADTLFSMVKNDCHDNWDTHFPTYIVRNSMALAGQEKINTLPGPKMHMEHVVPTSYLISECLKIIKNDQSVKQEDIAKILFENFHVINITKEKANIIDKQYKVKMPEGWRLGKHCPFDRLRLVFDENLQDKIAFAEGFKLQDKPSVIRQK